MRDSNQRRTDSGSDLGKDKEMKETSKPTSIDSRAFSFETDCAILEVVKKPFGFSSPTILDPHSPQERHRVITGAEIITVEAQSIRGLDVEPRLVDGRRLIAKLCRVIGANC